MGYVKASVRSKSGKMQFLESFPSFPNEIEQKEQIQIFYCIITNSLNPASRLQQQQGL